MKAAEYREMTDEELEVALEDSNKEIFNLRLQASLGQLENPSRLRTVRRQIALILTVKQERSLVKEA